MKSFFLIIFLLIITNLLFAQISIEKSDYFNVNDTIPRIFYGFEYDTQAIPKDSVWPSNMTFGDYQFPLTITDSMIFHPTTGTFFSNATCWFLTRDGVKMYMKISNDKAELVGAQTEMPFNQDTINFSFVDPLIITPFPSSYQSQNIDEGTAMDKRHISVFQSIIPPDYYNTISMLYDTVRFLMNIRINCNFDEVGNITFNGRYNLNGTFSYLRENRVMINTTDVQLRSKFNGSYTSLSQIPGIGDQLPMELPIIDTSKSHLYWVKTMKYPILEIEYTNNYDSIHNMTFRYAYLSNVEDFEVNFVKVYPNPASEYLNFYLNKAGNYTLIIRDFNGNLILQNNLSENIFKLNITELVSGIYIYQIYDNNSKLKILNGKFVKL